MRDKDLLGRVGEDAAARYLTDAGMRILDRNWRCAAGELDIVGRLGRMLVVCEVKTRSDGRFGSPVEAVGPGKAARLRRLAGRWLSVHRGRYTEIRIDVVGLTADASGRFVVEHLRGVG